MPIRWAKTVAAAALNCFLSALADDDDDVAATGTGAAIGGAATGEQLISGTGTGTART